MDVNIPTTIKDPTTRRFIEELIKLIAELDERLKKLEP